MKRTPSAAWPSQTNPSRKGKSTPPRLKGNCRKVEFSVKMNGPEGESKVKKKVTLRTAAAPTRKVWEENPIWLDHLPEPEPSEIDSVRAGSM